MGREYPLRARRQIYPSPWIDAGPGLIDPGQWSFLIRVQNGEWVGISTGKGIHDDFLELGGHSLLLTRIVMRIRKKFNVDLALSNLFEAPTIADFAQEVAKAKNSQPGKSASAITPVSRDLYRVKKNS